MILPSALLPSCQSITRKETSAGSAEQYTKLRRKYDGLIFFPTRQKAAGTTALAQCTAGLADLGHEPLLFSHASSEQAGYNNWIALPPSADTSDGGSWLSAQQHLIFPRRREHQIANQFH